MLDNRVALVTGATSGIGLAIARALAKDGATIAFSGLGEMHRIKAITSELTLRGRAAEYLQADARDGNQLTTMVERCEQAFGAVDILVNAAGIQHVAPIELLSPPQWNEILAVNLSAAYYTIRAALPGMRRRSWGRIINIASVHGLVASVNKCAYVSSKHGLVGLTKAVALETASSGITCNAICPGWVLTPLVTGQIEKNAEKKSVDFETARDMLLNEKQPSGKFVDADHIAGLASFLCSESGNEVRGAAWTIDGGWTAQ